jgi:hypothetical protein
MVLGSRLSTHKAFQNQEKNVVKTIHRRLQFTPDDVKEALLYWLRERDQPMPDDAYSTEFKLSADGADVAWSVSVNIPVEL